MGDEVTRKGNIAVVFQNEKNETTLFGKYLPPHLISNGATRKVEESTKNKQLINSYSSC